MRAGKRIGFAEPKVAGNPIDVAGWPVGIAAGDGHDRGRGAGGRAVQLIDEKTREARPARSGSPDRARIVVADGFAWATVPAADEVVKAPLDGSTGSTIDVGQATDRDHVRRQLRLGGGPEGSRSTTIDPATARCRTRSRSRRRASRPRSRRRRQRLGRRPRRRGAIRVDTGDTSIQAELPARRQPEGRRRRRWVGLGRQHRRPATSSGFRCDGDQAGRDRRRRQAAVARLRLRTRLGGERQRVGAGDRSRRRDGPKRRSRWLARRRRDRQRSRSGSRPATAIRSSGSIPAPRAEVPFARPRDGENVPGEDGTVVSVTGGATRGRAR